MELMRRKQVMEEAGKAPHSQLTDDQVMIRTLVAMSFPAIAAVLAMGTQATYNILVAVVTALVCHYILQAIDLKSPWALGESSYSSPYSPLVAGLIVGLCVGELSPLYVTAFISALTMVGFKWGQERLFGRKIINPVAGAKALILLTLTALWIFPDSLITGQLFYPSHLQYALYTREGFTGAMELAEQVGFYGTQNLSVFWSLILWKSHGWIGGASGIIVIMSGILLANWIKLKWRITVSFLATMAVLAVVMGLYTGGDIALRLAFHLFAGSVIFLAFFMATEPQTTPVTLPGQYYFGGILALLTMAGQLGGLFGSSFIALAIMNPFAPYFDRVNLKEPVGRTLREFSPFHGLRTAPDISSPVITYNSSRCIACSQCIKACEEIQGKGNLDYGSRGQTIEVTAGLGQRGASECDGCGECVQICPTGALQERRTTPPVRTWDAESAQSTCPHCGVGCQIALFSKHGEIGKVNGAHAAPNHGSLCVKGRFEHLRENSKKRLTRPLLRQNGRLRPVSWNRALTEVAGRLHEIRDEHGPDAIAALSSAETTNEDSYLLQKFMRTAIGTNNIDNRERMDHLSTTEGLKKAFGCSAMTNSLEEIEQAGCILLPPGCDIAQSHPVVATIIKRAVRERGADLVVIDRRRTDLASWATLWLRPEYGTESALFNGMMKVILDENLHDESFIEERTENYSELLESLHDYSPEKVEELTGVSADDLRKAAALYAGADSASIIYTEHDAGMDSIHCLTNLALLTGNVGKPSTGVNPLLTHSNVQGACDVGTLPAMLPGYQDVRDSAKRQRFSDAWGVDVPSEPGLSTPKMLDEAAAGNLKALLIMGTNPMMNAPDPDRVERALQQLDFTVVMDRTMTETAAEADVVLPLTALAEEDGSFTSTERRIRRVRAAVTPSAQVQPTWQILCALSDKMGYSMQYDNPAAIMDEIADLTPIYRGVSYQTLEGEGLHWPVQANNGGDSRFLYRERFPRGRARFIPVAFEPAQVDDDRYPFLLSSGRMLFEGGLGSLRSHWDDESIEEEFGYVEIHSDDADNLDIVDGDRVQLTTEHGEMHTTAKVTDRVAPGSLFLPLHAESAPPMFITRNMASDGEASARTTVPCQVRKVDILSIGGVTGVRKAQAG